MLGGNDKSWAVTFFGIVQSDYIIDTTRSYNEIRIGGSLVARDDTYEGTAGRTQFSMRNTRFGFMLDSPVVGNWTPSAVLQGDFAGNQPGVPYVPPGQPGPSPIPESAYYGSPTFRVRHAYVVLKSPYFDMLAGQTFDLFGWQSFYLGVLAAGPAKPGLVAQRAVHGSRARSVAAGRSPSTSPSRRHARCSATR